MARRRSVSFSIPWFWIIIVMSIIYNVANKDDDKKDTKSVKPTITVEEKTGTISQGEATTKKQMEEALGKVTESLSEALQAASERVKEESNEFFAKKKENETLSSKVEESTKAPEEKPAPKLEAEKLQDNSGLRSLDEVNPERNMKKL